MNNIPTAEEFIAKHSINYKKTIEKDEKSLYHLVMNGFEARNAMIEFAKAHVREALEAAADNSVKLSHTKDTVRAAYPLENIK